MSMRPQGYVIGVIGLLLANPALASSATQTKAAPEPKPPGYIDVYNDGLWVCSDLACHFSWYFKDLSEGWQYAVEYHCSLPYRDCKVVSWKDTNNLVEPGKPWRVSETEVTFTAKVGQQSFTRTERMPFSYASPMCPHDAGR